jgi:hypothetical protein
MGGVRWYKGMGRGYGELVWGGGVHIGAMRETGGVREDIDVDRIVLHLESEYKVIDENSRICYNHTLKDISIFLCLVFILPEAYVNLTSYPP